jgi:hypothetical protein
MDVVGPFRAASLVWQPRAGAVTLTVVCKATYELRPVESPLAAEQDLPNEEDNHWNDDPSRSLYSPCDLVPRKSRADVILVGNAFAPRGQPVRSMLVRLCVGEVDKAIEVCADRFFTQEGKLREGPAFVKMPVRYERAAGGPDTDNPVGVRADGPPDLQGQIAIPNLQPPGFAISRRGDQIPVVGFGPIAPSWPERVEKLGRHAGEWPDPDWMKRPIPADVDRAYFNAAPSDQQLEELRDDERILLENLHPEHSRLSTALPGVRPRATIERPGKGVKPIEMKADTLWIDTDRGLCTLTWRGQTRLEYRDEPVNVRIFAERGGRPLIAPPGETPVPRQAPATTASLSPVDFDEVSADEEPTGAVQASNAAAATEVRGPEPTLPSLEAKPTPAPRREALKLLWFDPRSVGRIREHPSFRAILGDPGEGEAPGDEPRPTDRRDVFEVLAKARPIGPEGVRPALDAAIGDDGKFEPPLVVLGGELEFSFDELATLRATAATVSPFASADRRLREQLGLVEELLKTPWLQGSGSIADRLTDELVEVFAQGKRPVGLDYLTAHTEQILLEQRCYQTRTVFGKRWIRSVLVGSGVPVYVPEALRDELPMFRRFKVKMIGEVDMQEDQFESETCAIKAIALGRVMG